MTTKTKDMAASGNREHDTSDLAVREALFGFLNGVNHMNLDMMASFLADDVTAFAPAGLWHPERSEGKPAVVEFLRAFVKAASPPDGSSPPLLNLAPEDARLEISGNLAVASLCVHLGPELRRRTFALRRTEGRWLIFHIHSSNVPLAV